MIKNTLVIILMLCCVWALQAQENFPARPYGPDEVISFTPNVPFNTAMEILNGMSQKFENRIIIDSKLRNKPIGVSVENMHWKRAFEYILRSNMMRYAIHDRYYQIEEGLAQKEKEATDPININTREIEINAVFFQADYGTLRELGIDWSTFRNGTVSFQTFGASNVVQEFLRVTASGTINGTLRVDALLRAFESRSKGEVIARPQIRVIDGQEGKIKVGKNFYLTLQDFAGNTRFTEYEAGVILTVKPTIYGRNDSVFIYLDALAERSDVQPDDIGVTKNITEGRTQVLLLNGEETVMAGLVSHEVQQIRKGIPLLKDIPLLTYIFGYNSKTVSKKELIILIEARIVPGLLTRTPNQIDIPGYFKRQWQDVKRNASGTNGATRAPRTSTSTRGDRRSSPKKP